MVKGITRQVILVKSPDPKLFEEAIFLVKEEALAREGVSADQVLKEARDERKKGFQVLTVTMNKNKKFQKEQLAKEGYTEFKEFFNRD